MIGKHFKRFLKKSEVPKARKKFSEKLKGAEHGSLNLEAQKKDGSSIFIELVSSLVKQDGAVLGTQGIIRDVTEHKKAQQELQKARDELESRVQQRTADLAEAVEQLKKEIAERRQAEETLRRTEQRFKTIFDHTVVGFYRTTPGGRILLANPSLIKMLGYDSFEELSRLNLEKEGIDISTPRWVFKKRVEEQSRIIGLESVWLKRDGSKLFVSESAHVERDAKGKVLYYEGTVQDITKRKEAEEKLLDYQEQLRSLASQLSLAEERLRRRIATELHDHIAQNLAISKIKLAALADTASTQDRAKQMREINDLIAQAIEDTRSLTFEVSPPVLYELGFEAALGWLARQAGKRFGLKVDFIDDGLAKPLDNDVTVMLFQAVRELLVNVAKHAKTAKARITTKKIRNTIRIIVEDKGAGFDASGIGTRDYTKGGFGLFNIRERLNFIGGKIEIRSKPSRGTKVMLFAPLLKNNNKPAKTRLKLT
jgi:PAS domain S-box-containing protein